VILSSYSDTEPEMTTAEKIRALIDAGMATDDQHAIVVLEELGELGDGDES